MLNIMSDAVVESVDEFERWSYAVIRSAERASAYWSEYVRRSYEWIGVDCGKAFEVETEDKLASAIDRFKGAVETSHAQFDTVLCLSIEFREQIESFWRAAQDRYVARNEKTGLGNPGEEMMEATLATQQYLANCMAGVNAYLQRTADLQRQQSPANEPAPRGRRRQSAVA